MKLTKTQMNRLTENEIKIAENIIANCEIPFETIKLLNIYKDISRDELKEPIIDLLAEELDFDSYDMYLPTFLKKYDIQKEQLCSTYCEGINEYGYSIAYPINEEICLILE